MNIISQIKKLLTKIKRKSKKPKLIVVLGQTSTGKSDIAVEIAQKYHGEIISADSRQVYVGMDLGSGKITKKEMQNIPHHLLDICDPKEIFDVKKFQELGTNAINNILNKGETPIICGGTGFYIDSLVYKTRFTSVKPNKKLREILEKKSLLELQNIIRNKSQKIAKRIDLENPIRIIRALEIIDKLGHIPKIKKSNNYNTLFIGLSVEKNILDKRIKKRIVKRLEYGMLNEAKNLIEGGVTHKRLQSLGLEYRFMSKHILGKISKEEMIDQLYRATVQFAKRQKTWFRGNKKIHWLNPINDKKEIFNMINIFLEK